MLNCDNRVGAVNYLFHLQTQQAAFMRNIVHLKIIYMNECLLTRTHHAVLCSRLFLNILSVCFSRSWSRPV